MRIAINGLFLREPHTGTGQYLTHLLGELARPGTPDEIVVVAPRDVNRELPRVRTVKINDHKSGLGTNLAKLWFEQISFPRACAALKAEVAHVPHWGPPLRPPVPTLVTIHDIIPLVLPLYRGSLAVRLYTRLVSAAAQRAKLISADSECSARDIAAKLKIARDKIRVVYLAADSTYYQRPAEECAKVRTKLGLPKDFALYLGGFDARKNLSVLMRAMARLHDTGTTFVCAGALPERDSELFPDPRRLAREAGLGSTEVRFIGPVDEADKPALYSAARAFVFASRYEGFGLPPLEAMACGTPTLAARAGSLPEVVGQAGRLLDPEDAGAWADALREVLTGEKRYESARAAGLQQAKKFSWTRTAQETRALYEEIKQ
ncbi:MAG TPA: glycosyltransferase family 1 protein [Anaerolineae bacterium]